MGRLARSRMPTSESASRPREAKGVRAPEQPAPHGACRRVARWIGKSHANRAAAARIHRAVPSQPTRPLEESPRIDRISVGLPGPLGPMESDGSPASTPGHALKDAPTQ